MQENPPPHTPALASAPPFHWPVRVYYEDTDAAGVVYYANYLRFCERARTEWLRAAGFNQQALMATHGLGFMVRRVEADYRRPAVLDDALEVVSRVTRLGRAGIDFEQAVLRGGERLFEARVALACVDLAQGKPAPLPADVRESLIRFVSA